MPHPSSAQPTSASLRRPPSTSDSFHIPQLFFQTRFNPKSVSRKIEGGSSDPAPVQPALTLTNGQCRWPLTRHDNASTIQVFPHVARLKKDARYWPLEQLHERRREMVRLHRKGYGVIQIAEFSGLSYPTVRSAINQYNGVAPIGWTG
ncbi:MAG TPA: helix-turn-helix domain-containing protein [Accumulibacter sp.]|nr:helix-turn-helix domain-containing protein [Accumulibacter sp.]